MVGLEEATHLMHRDAGTRRGPSSVPAVRANTVRLPEEMWAHLDEESRRSGVSQGELIRQAVALRRALLVLTEASSAGKLEDVVRELLGNDG